MTRPAAALLAGLAAALPTGACATPPRPAGPTTAIAVAVGGAVLCCSTGCVELDDRAIAVPWPGRAVAAAAHPDGGFVVGGGEPGRSGWVCRVTARGAFGPAVTLADDVVQAVAAAGDGRVAAGAADGGVWLDATSTPRAVAAHAGPCRAVAFAPDAAALVSAGRDGRLLFVDVAGGDAREVLDHTAGVECLAIAADGAVASGGRDGRVRLHDPAGALLRTWQRLGAAPLCLLPHGDAFVVGLDDGRVLRLERGADAPRPLADLGAPVHALALAGDTLLLGLQRGRAARHLDRGGALGAPAPPVSDGRR